MAPSNPYKFRVRDLGARERHVIRAEIHAPILHTHRAESMQPRPSASNTWRFLQRILKILHDPEYLLLAIIVQ